MDTHFRVFKARFYIMVDFSSVVRRCTSIIDIMKADFVMAQEPHDKHVFKVLKCRLSGRSPYVKRLGETFPDIVEVDNEIKLSIRDLMMMKLRF